MFERAYQPKVTATARPLRIAYFVDAQDCPNECIDAIFEEAYIWMLSVLAERARASFYFSPALNYWNDYPNRDDDGPDVEVDALVVVDGLLFMCEAKMSSGLDTGEIAKLALAAERIRPDFVLLAFADALTGKAAAAKKALSLVVPAGVQVETINRL